MAVGGLSAVNSDQTQPWCGNGSLLQ